MLGRDRSRLRRCAAAAERVPAGGGGAGRHQLSDRPGDDRGRARLRPADGELDRRRLRPRLRAGLSGGGRDLRRASLAACRGAGPVVDAAVRLRADARGLHLRQLDHAAEAQSRRRRAGARQVGADPGRTCRRCWWCSRACRSPIPRTCRRTRRACSTPPTAWSCASPPWRRCWPAMPVDTERMRAAAGVGLHHGHRPRRLAGARARACRSARRTAWRRAWCAGRERGCGLEELTLAELRQSTRGSTPARWRCWASTARSPAARSFGGTAPERRAGSGGRGARRAICRWRSSAKP